MIVKELGTVYPDTGGISEYRLETKDGGTLLTKAIARPIGPFIGRAMMHMMKPLFSRLFPQIFDRFKQAIEDDYRAQRVEHVGEVGISDEQIREAAENSLQASVNSQ